MIGGTIAQKDNQPFSPQCSIDGKPSQLAQHSDHVGLLCVGQNLAKETHTITVSVPASHSMSQLWVDFIQYMPSSPPSDGGTLLTLGNDFAALGPEWGSNQGDGTSFDGVQTNVDGAGINVNFTGTFRDDIFCLNTW